MVAACLFVSFNTNSLIKMVENCKTQKEDVWVGNLCIRTKIDSMKFYPIYFSSK